MTLFRLRRTLHMTELELAERRSLLASLCNLQSIVLF